MLIIYTYDSLLLETVYKTDSNYMLQRKCIHQWQRHLEGLEVGKCSPTSYGINTENSWKDAIEGGDFASIGCYIKAMFDALKSANETGHSSWTKLTKRGSLLQSLNQHSSGSCVSMV